MLQVQLLLSLAERVALPSADALIPHLTTLSARRRDAALKVHSPPTSAPGLGSPRAHLHRDWTHPAHICARTGLIPATSAPGVGSPLPHLRRDRCCRCRRSSLRCVWRMCSTRRYRFTRHALDVGSPLPTSAPGNLGSSLPTSAPGQGLRTGAHRCHIGTSRGADVVRVSPVPVRMWQRRAQSRCRCGGGEPSPGADVAGVSPVPVQMWQRRAAMRLSNGRSAGASGAHARVDRRRALVARADGGGARVLRLAGGARLASPCGAGSRVGLKFRA